MDNNKYHKQTLCITFTKKSQENATSQICDMIRNSEPCFYDDKGNLVSLIDGRYIMKSNQIKTNP